MILSVALTAVSASAQVPPAELPHASMPVVAILAPAPQPPPVAPPAAEPELKLSYGNQEVSLLFTGSQITAMKSAIRNAEGPKDAPPVPVAINDPELAAAIQPAVAVLEPVTYPVFTLNSVFYRDAMDWIVWVSKQRITPRSNDGELQVTAVAGDSVSFRWKPSYADVVARRYGEKKFASVDTIRNRLANKDSVRFNAEDNSVAFTLHPNQSFSAGHMNIFEGRVTPVALPGLVATVTAAVSKSTATTDSASLLLNDLAGDNAGAAAAPATSAAPAKESLSDFIKRSESAPANQP